MPLSSFRCDVTRQPVHFKDCVGCAEKGQARQMGCLHSPDILRGIVGTIRKPMQDVSVTELLDCPRALYLKKKNEYSDRPSRLYYAFRGTMVHAMIEAGQQEGDISEVRMYANVGPWRLSGQPDLIRKTSIYDWKTTRQIPDKPKEDHIIQLSCYRWIASKQTPAIEVKDGFVTYIDMMRHAMLPAELWSLADTEKWITEKLGNITKVLAEAEPPKFEDHFSPFHWKCGRDAEKSYCEVRDLCTKGKDLEPEPAKPRKVKSSKD